MKHSIPCCLLVLCSLLSVHTALAQPYKVDTLARAPNAQYPVHIAFTPDNSGKFFVTEKNSGRVRIYESALLPEPFATVSVEEEGEQGLLGVTMHPSYPDSPYVYVFYTRSLDRSNIVERFVDSSGIGINPTIVLLVPRRDDAANNIGGSIHFGPDEKLYVSVGDNGSNPASAQDTTSSRSYRGKILRLNENGSIPSDNPFPKKPFWSFGHRNSTDFTFDENTGMMYCTQNGAKERNEISPVPRGGNLGWPHTRVPGHHAMPQYVRPLYTFADPAQPGLNGIAMYHGRAFPRLNGKILVAGSSIPVIWTGTFSPEKDSLFLEPFFKSHTGFTDIQVGPDGNIYITNGPYLASRILRLVPVGPEFISAPLPDAMQGRLYSYTPSFRGTPPGVSIVLGPEGMYIDSTTWTVRWVPTNAQALADSHLVILAAGNGAGTTQQTYTIHVVNVNDPPDTFRLFSPSTDTTLSFIGLEPTVRFAWEAAQDPDQDTVRYTIELDSLNTFSSPALRSIPAGTSTSLTSSLPRNNREYFWRVRAFDGFASTTSSEVRQLTISFVPPIHELREKPKEFVLEQNFPNPVNPSTAIQYVLPKAGRVRLAVYNMLGQQVALVFEGTQNPGTYEFTFDSANLPSGIYFYRIQAPTFVETKKMIIAR